PNGRRTSRSRSRRCRAPRPPVAMPRGPACGGLCPRPFLPRCGRWPGAVARLPLRNGRVLVPARRLKCFSRVLGSGRAPLGVGPVSREDLEDLASGKALELLQHGEGKRWSTAGHGPREVAGFVARVARNGLIDLARRRGREAPPPEDAAGWERAFAEPAAGEV